METEIITQLRGAEGYYCSNKGHIINKNGRVLNGFKMNGYVKHRLIVNGKQKTINTARAIYESFCGPLDAKCEIDHRDGRKTNNKLSNLRPMTHKENMNNPVTKARMSKPHKRSSKTYVIPDTIK